MSGRLNVMATDACVNRSSGRIAQRQPRSFEMPAVSELTDLPVSPVDKTWQLTGSDGAGIQRRRRAGSIRPLGAGGNLTRPARHMFTRIKKGLADDFVECYPLHPFVGIGFDAVPWEEFGKDVRMGLDLQCQCMRRP
jgi:hypothetical protein